jgi:hypothetical protein
VCSSDLEVNYLIPFDESILSYPQIQKLSTQMKISLDKYGSDKANHHTYQDIYAFILNKINATNTSSILEIGIGSTEQPSKRAFFEFIRNNNFNINYIGVDINKNFLTDPSQQGITLLHFDQLERNSAAVLIAKLQNHNISLIIDDGLHTAEANISAFNNLMDYVNNGAIYIIEDVNRNQLPFWEEVPKLFPLLHFKVRNMTDVGPYDNIQIIIHNNEVSWL